MFRRLKKRKKIATLVDIGLGDNAIQLITDSMANQLSIEIEYEGSGRRTCTPYAWSVSRNNDLLMMCYKQDGNVRSYRFDRMLQIKVEDSLIDAYNSVSEEPELQEIQIGNNSPDEYTIPELPDIDRILEESENEEPDLPYDEAIEMLDDVQETQDLDIQNNITQEDLVNSINNQENVNTQNQEFDEIQDWRDVDENTEQSETDKNRN